MGNLLKLWTWAWKFCEKITKITAKFFVASYRTLGTTHLGGCCRFDPSCSAYALESIETHPIHKALWLITKRVCKCRPGGPYGYDPVPILGVNAHESKK